MSSENLQRKQEARVVLTPLQAEFNEPFRAAIERLLGRQTVWVE